MRGSVVRRVRALELLLEYADLICIKPNLSRKGATSMSMLKRYHKAGGFNQLIRLIEEQEPAKREKFLQLIEEEDPVWASLLRKKTLSFNKVLSWDPGTLALIFRSIKPYTLASAIWPLEDEQKSLVLDSLTERQQEQVREYFDGPEPRRSEVDRAQSLVLAWIRDMDMVGSLRLADLNSELWIEDGIEEKIRRGEMDEEVTVMANLISTQMPDSETSDHSDASTPESELDGLRVRVRQLERENRLLRATISTLKKRLGSFRKSA